MFYLYFIDNFGRKTEVIKTESKEKISENVKKELKILDPDTDRYLIITTKEIPTWRIG